MNKLTFHDAGARPKLIAIAAISLLFVGGLISMQTYGSGAGSRETNTTADKLAKPPTKEELAKLADDSKQWTSVTSKNKALTMQVPDGWSMVSFPNDRLGATTVIYTPGTPAKTETVESPYASFELRLNVQVTTGHGKSALRAQWESPQPGLTETSEDITLGSLNGKRFRGIFDGTLHQTLYHYVFDLGNGKRLSVVYTVYNGDKTDLATIEQVIRTIQVK